MVTATDLLDDARGRSLTEIAKTGIGGWLLAVAVSLISGTMTVLEFLFLPFTLFADVAGQSIQNFIIEPMTLVPAGVSETIGELSAFGIAAGPVATIVAIIMIVIVIAATALPITSSVIIGVVVDNPIWDGLFGTPEEEEEED